MVPAIPRRVSPSDIARYFFHDCERFLRFRVASTAERAAWHIPKHEFDRSPLMQAILSSGYRWEEEVVGKLLDGKVHVAAGEGELNRKRFGLDDTLALLHATKPGSYIYQATLRATPGFYDHHGLAPALVAIADNHPDLIAVLPEADRRLLRVIDVKRGAALQLTHRVQILLYSLELQAMLEDAGIADARVDLEQAAVWLGGHDAPEEFDLNSVRPHLEQFLRSGLMTILEKSPADACWHLQHRCEWCDFFDHCREEMRKTDDLSRLSALSGHGKRYLVHLGVRNLPELETFLGRPQADAVLSGCASLAGEKHYLLNKVQALRTGKPVTHDAASPSLPRGENIVVLLTLQREPLGGTTYLAGMLVNAKQDLQEILFDRPTRQKLFDEHGKAQPNIMIADQPHQVIAVRRQFVRLLHDVLRQVDQFNRRRDWKDQLTLQVYVHTERERDHLTEWLLECLHEADLAAAGMTLLLQFQGPDLMATDEHPEMTFTYPVIPLAAVLGKLLAVPVDVSYTLPETLRALGSGFDYQRKKFYHYPIGHGLRSDAIHAAWHRNMPEQIASLRQEARLYLFALWALLREVRTHAKDQLFAWAAKFAFPPVADIHNPLLSRLAFFARYESLIACMALREQRSEARTVQATLGTTLELMAVDGLNMHTVGDPLLEVEKTDFPAWLLVRDNDAGRRAQLEFKDYSYRNYPSSENFGPKPADNLAIVGIKDDPTTDELGFVRGLHLKPGKNFASGPPQHGERFLLYPRFQDYNADRIIDFLQDCDSAGGGLFLQVLRDTERAAGLGPLPGTIERAAAAVEKDLKFTDSQERAFREIRRRKVVAVWGPPGTGKTHFLATAVVGLAAAHACTGKPFRVLVTAFTHSAIENLLRKMVQRQQQLSFAGLDLVVAKVKEWKSSENAPIEVIEEKHAAAWISGHAVGVIGATVYSCLKGSKSDHWPAFDLVIVDEASQVRVPEASVPFSMVAPAGRIVLAGDHLQLPPHRSGRVPRPSARPANAAPLHLRVVASGCEHSQPGCPEAPRKPPHERPVDSLRP